MSFIIYEPERKIRLTTDFKIYQTDENVMGLRTFGFKSCITGELTFLKVAPYQELISIFAHPIREFTLLSRFSDFGFLISPKPDAIFEFFNFLIFPENTYVQTSHELPSIATAQLITSYDFKNNEYL